MAEPPETDLLAGLMPGVCPFNSDGGGYLAFLGRISPEKRPDRAIEIAKRAGIPLKLAAKVDAADFAYFKTAIEPLLDHPLIEFIGEIGETQKKSKFLGNARALLFPIDWPEPFGLVMVEAMSAGTPVIAWPNGSVPEVVADGVSGRIVYSIEAAVEAVREAAHMDRARFVPSSNGVSPPREWRVPMSRRIVRFWLARRLRGWSIPWRPRALELLPPAWGEVAGECDATALNPVS